MNLDHTLTSKKRLVDGTPCYEIMRVYIDPHRTVPQAEIRYIDDDCRAPFYLYVVREDMKDAP